MDSQSLFQTRTGLMLRHTFQRGFIGKACILFGVNPFSVAPHLLCYWRRERKQIFEIAWTGGRAVRAAVRAKKSQGEILADLEFPLANYFPCLTPAK
jgi:hypothetical protein